MVRSGVLVVVVFCCFFFDAIYVVLESSRLTYSSICVMAFCIIVVIVVVLFACEHSRYLLVSCVATALAFISFHVLLGYTFVFVQVSSLIRKISVSLSAVRVVPERRKQRTWVGIL